ncbi:MAG: adenylyltransferase/cytidyltransferase family protein [Chloroflexi bacterium]|nr:adenylyltransferase/cytidyltransferase family protein [Chloroflexota bacterium]
MTLPRLLALRDGWRRHGVTLVFTNGCFDLLHPGHLHLLEGARSLGDLLVVGLNSDASLRGLKGEERAFIPQDGRSFLLAGFACVDYVVIFDERTAESLVRALQPEVYVKGGDYSPTGEKAPPEAVVVAGYGGRVVILPTLPSYSTSALIERIRGR